MISFRRVSLVVCGAFALFACQKDAASAAPAAAAPAGPPKQVVQLTTETPDVVVARIQGRDVKLKEVDEVISEQLKDLEKQRFQLRKQGAEQLAVQTMAKAEAAKVGMTDDEWMRKKAEEGTAMPTDAEVAAEFEKLKDQIPPGTSLEMVKPKVVQYIQQNARRKKMEALFADLKKQAGFELLISEPRVKVDASGPSKGPANAPITIVEFSDFQCPFCSRAEPSVDEVMKKYAGKVKVVFRHFPLSFHENAAKAAEAAACAEEQGKFWEYHKALFSNQGKLLPDDLKEHAKTIGLDGKKFAECLDTGKMKTKVDADMKAGREAGVNGTPAFFINGVALSGALPIEEFSRVIDGELK